MVKYLVYLRMIIDDNGRFTLKKASVLPILGDKREFHPGRTAD